MKWEVAQLIFGLSLVACGHSQVCTVICAQIRFASFVLFRQMHWLIYLFSRRTTTFSVPHAIAPRAAIRQTTAATLRTMEIRFQVRDEIRSVLLLALSAIKACVFQFSLTLQHAITSVCHRSMAVTSAYALSCLWCSRSPQQRALGEGVS